MTSWDKDRGDLCPVLCCCGPSCCWAGHEVIKVSLENMLKINNHVISCSVWMLHFSLFVQLSQDKIKKKSYNLSYLATLRMPSQLQYWTLTGAVLISVRWSCWGEPLRFKTANWPDLKDFRGANQSVSSSDGFMGVSQKYPAGKGKCLQRCVSLPLTSCKIFMEVEMHYNVSRSIFVLLYR